MPLFSWEPQTKLCLKREPEGKSPGFQSGVANFRGSCWETIHSPQTEALLVQVGKYSLSRQLHGAFLPVNISERNSSREQS